MPALRALRDRFVAGRVDSTYLDSTPVRRIVADSWRRSLATGVDPDRGGGQIAQLSDTVERLRSAHPLAPVLPLIRRLLIDDAADSGVIVAVTSADGTLLWVDGDRRACRKAESMDFVPGADWSERGAGTNAPGTALALDRELQIRGSEHFSRLVQPWNCTAVPVHDPSTGVLIGAIDLTGGESVASPQTLALLRATGVAVESQLALLRSGAVQPQPSRQAQLSVLGAQRPSWRVAGMGPTMLAGRHADILVLLDRHPEGLSADHLAVLLDDRELDVVTIRAEMSRLRRVVGEQLIASRPYRLTEPIATDVGDVFDAVRRGDLAEALRYYAGALLPQSVSPGVARVRTELSNTLRAAVVASNDADLLANWLRLPEARDDRQGWRMLYDRSPAGSPRRAQAQGHLAGLDFDLA
ncbi:Acetoin dehydrogenase operon transcriptional activator AcoR [Mycobacterium marinum]|uniref:Acetoin dehydrogenase operon transcriptional activator AcoR n=1 Tax=Mycobacterium marinum TaxID=1781 RepID=A0A3E2MWJ0_MYCMR|nr:GAF domain-containing protein [Mycobacterium marinum]RFZ41764.1 Acetoin dehydrogenase operon transcriptional activator AcoR [Mycobacterium marinum]GJO50817.1 transcriptional regulator [Mycobacterium marinum]